MFLTAPCPKMLENTTISSPPNKNTHENIFFLKLRAQRHREQYSKLAWRRSPPHRWWFVADNQSVAMQILLVSRLVSQSQSAIQNQSVSQSVSQSASQSLSQNQSVRVSQGQSEPVRVSQSHSESVKQPFNEISHPSSVSRCQSG